MVFVPVVPVVVRHLLESFWLSFVMPRPSRSTNNSLSAGLPTEDSLPSTAASESPVSSTASSSWSPQLADSLTEAVVRAIGNTAGVTVKVRHTDELFISQLLWRTIPISPTRGGGETVLNGRLCPARLVYIV